MRSDVDRVSGPGVPFVIDKVAHSNKSHSTHQTFYTHTNTHIHPGAYNDRIQLEWREFNTEHCSFWVADGKGIYSFDPVTNVSCRIDGISRYWAIYAKGSHLKEFSELLTTK